MPACSAKLVPSHLSFYRKVKTSDAEQVPVWQPGTPSVQETEDDVVATASPSLQISIPPCFQGGISKGTISNIPKQIFVLEPNDSKQACKLGVGEDEHGYLKNICLGDGGGGPEARWTAICDS